MNHVAYQGKMTLLHIFVQLYGTSWALKELWQNFSFQTAHIQNGKGSLFKKLWVEVGLKMMGPLSGISVYFIGHVPEMVI